MARRPGTIDNGTVFWDEAGDAFFWMGEGTPKVPMSMHRANRERLCAALRASKEVPAEACVVLKGGDELPVYDTDTNWDFKQESNFQYLFGVKEPGCMAALRVKDAKAVLFVPQLAKEYQAWFGPIKPPAWFQRAYAVDEADFVENVAAALEALGEKQQPPPLLFFKGGKDGDPREGENRDSGLRLPEPVFEGLERFAVSAVGSQALWDALNECRAVKSADELRILKYVNDVSSRAHVETMRAVRAGQREHLAEATFKFHAATRGCFRVGYGCICGSGPRNAILHYGHPAEPNPELVPEGSLRLLDMGAEYHCYSADVTCTFPVSGRFSDSQRVVYEAVWAAVLAVERSIKPGVSYKDMHRLAQRTLLEQMRACGLLVGTVEEMLQKGLMFYFMPHGLGHMLGLDVHDVGGYPPGAFRKDDPSVRENLRLGRELKQGFVLTVEPGFYFIDYLIEEVRSDPVLSAFVNWERLEALREVGGVRIEDDVVVTATGCRVLTCVPRTVGEIEAVLAGQEWTISEASCREYVAAT